MDDRSEPSRADLIRAQETQAQAMIRRVSPQGRAEAQREQAIRRRRVRGLALGWIAIVVAVFVAYRLLDAEAGPFGTTGFAAAMAVMILACALLALRTRPRTAAAAIDPAGRLTSLGERTQAWAAAQRPALPAPAVSLLDGIGARLDSLAPDLARIGDASPDGDALRRLVGGELPALVDSYRAVPAPLRAEPGSDGASPDARLLHGLATVDRQLADLTRRIGAGAMDGLSTHDRFLDTKYRADDPLGG